MTYVGLEKIGFGVGMLGAGPVGWVVGADFIMWGMFDTVCGVSDIYEASQHTVMAISGKNWRAVNPVCDTFFDDDKVLYSIVETTSVAFTGPAMQMASYYLPQLQALSNTIVQGLKREKSATNTGEGGLNSLSKPSSKVLRENMVKAGIETPDYPNAAHHIVAGSSPKANEARAVLQKYGVDINDAENGVFLPTQKGVSNSAYHPSLHTNAYYDKVNKLLSEATCEEDVLDILEYICDELIDGTFMQ